MPLDFTSQQKKKSLKHSDSKLIGRKNRAQYHAGRDGKGTDFSCKKRARERGASSIPAAAAKKEEKREPHRNTQLRRACARALSAFELPRELITRPLGNPQRGASSEYSVPPRAAPAAGGEGERERKRSNCDEHGGERAAGFPYSLLKRIYRFSRCMQRRCASPEKKKKVERRWASAKVCERGYHAALLYL